MLAIPGKVYKRREGRTSRYTDIVVVALAHHFYDLHKELVVYRFADTDPENGLCYYMPIHEFERDFLES